jgi:CHASE3 domain sensor protein
MDSLIAQFGLPGLVIFGMGVALKMLWERLSDSQDKRIAESRETLTVMKATTDAAESVAKGQEAVARGFEALKAIVERGNGTAG